MGRKWQNIKLDKGKTDSQRGALFTRLSREITLSAKSGSPDPESNHRLKIAVEKAREHNMPSDNVKRAIARAGGTGEKEIEEIRYEGYGPAGLAVVVDAATDNRNRTAGEFRFMFTKYGGQLGETGSVGWMFDAVGVIEVDPQGASEDALTESALVDGVIDVDYTLTPPKSLRRRRNLPPRATRCAARSKWPTSFSAFGPNRPSLPREAGLAAALAFLDVLDEHEDRAARLQQSRLGRGSAGGAHLNPVDARLAVRVGRHCVARAIGLAIVLSLPFAVGVAVWFGHRILSELFLPPRPRRLPFRHSSVRSAADALQPVRRPTDAFAAPVSSRATRAIVSPRGS